MLIGFGEVTRGRGKVFARVISQDVPEGCHISLSVCTAGGAGLPSRLVVDDRTGWLVAIMPVLERSQVARLEAVDAKGMVIASADQVFSPSVTKLRSRANTLMRDPVALSIRNVDARISHAPVRVSVTGIVTDADGFDIVRGQVAVTSCSRTAVDAPVELIALDPEGVPFRDGFVVMGDQTAPDATDPALLTRTVSFSLRIPGALTSVTVWARGGDPSLGDGFACVDPASMADLRGAWRLATRSAQADPRYEDWFLEHHRSKGDALEAQRRHQFDVMPTFSVVVPLFRTPPSFLKEMAASVLCQSYQHLELILVNASPEDAGLAEAVGSLAAADGRVRVVGLAGNRGITENTNAGVAVATGDFVCFLDHDDVIEPDLLFWYARAVNDHPDTDLIYCDEDKLDEHGHLFCPFFKPDWSPELLCSSNYVCHLLTVRRSVLDGLEPATSDYDGAQDHHLTFRVGERARNVYHVRRVLYHWRSHSGSTAADAGSKGYTTEAGRRAVQAHLDRCGIAATAVPDDVVPNTFHLTYGTPGDPLVSIVIPNKDEAAMLERCVTSIYERSTYRAFEIVIVENNSTRRETFALYKRLRHEHANLRVVTLEGLDSFNFARIVNFGVAAARGDYVLLLNNDTQVITAGWIEHLLGPCLTAGVGVTGAKLLYPDDTIQHAGVVFHLAGPDHLGKRLPKEHRDGFNLLNVSQNLSAVTGACLMVSHALFDELGGLDEELAVGYNDIDFCLRVRERGLRVVWRAEAQLYHFESVSRGVDAIASASPSGMRCCRENGIMMQRWPRYYAYGDPYMSPSFDFSPSYRQLRVK